MSTLTEFREAYLDYLEEEREDKPSLDGLNPEDRQRAEAWIQSLDAARGIDPYSERPSTEELLTRVFATPESRRRAFFVLKS